MQLTNRICSHKTCITIIILNGVYTHIYIFNIKTSIFLSYIYVDLSKNIKRKNFCNIYNTFLFNNNNQKKKTQNQLHTYKLCLYICEDHTE